MNTMELVRFEDRTQPRPPVFLTRDPLFHAQLIGPARRAILLARQRLLREQRDDGSWVGFHAEDASLPSQLIFLLTYLDEPDSTLAQQAATTILDQQLPNGGWSSVQNGPADLSVSVQAYFALKLTGLDVSDDRLRRARIFIRQLGGADVADVTTRHYLALLGQVDYNCCPPISPESQLVESPRALSCVPIALIWSLRAVRKLGMDRGVRELFVSHPSEWPAALETTADVKPAKRMRVARFLFEVLGQFCGWCGWAPFRRRAHELAETRLIEQVSEASIQRLSFSELVWHTIALQAIGYSPDSDVLARCQRLLNDMIYIDEDSDRAIPRHRSLLLQDTLSALECLRVSGLATSHPAIVSGMKWLSRSRRTKSSGDVNEFASLIQLLKLVENEVHTDGALPPDIEVNCLDKGRSNCTRPTNKLSPRLGPVILSLVRQLLARQCSDGGWGPQNITGIVLESIAGSDYEAVQPAVDRAIACLRSSQRADGSWADEAGTQRLNATSAAIRGLCAAGIPVEDDAIAAGLNWLAVHQLGDGGWTESADDPYANSNPSDTAAGLLAYQSAGQVNHTAALRAVNFLIDSQSDDGDWDNVRLGIQDAPPDREFRDNLRSVPWPLLALSRWAVVAASATSSTSDRIPLRLVAAPGDG